MEITKTKTIITKNGILLQLEGDNYIEFSIDYSLGGTNYYNGEKNRRGIYLYIRKIEYKTEGNFILKSFAMLGEKNDCKILLCELKKNNPKKKDDLFKKLIELPANVLHDMYFLSDRYDIVMSHLSI